MLKYLFIKEKTMEKLILTGNEIMEAGIPESASIGMAIKIAADHFHQNEKEKVLEIIRAIAAEPASFTNDEKWIELAKSLIPVPDETIMLDAQKEYSVFGKDFIEEGAIKQMNIAMKLPVTVAGALMPDAHQGYGLPIGGVLATENAVIPYGVGVDIGCRMSLSIFDFSEEYFLQNEAKFKRELIAQSVFGAGAGFVTKFRKDHAVLEDEAFKINNFIAGLKDKSWSQLGSSGGGNHFVEWGIINFKEDDTELNIPKGKYVALLSHSGSRGMGATIAGHYTKLAKSICKLPPEAANLAYLSLDSSEGQEYWMAMNLAGEYASACHEIIHEKIQKAIGGEVLARVENHHNFAWKETWNGKPVIVHRKGATPAGKGVMGIIPGSMTAPGFLVRGKGNIDAVASASHGAGRQMSRTRANKEFSKNDLRLLLKEKGVSLIGGGTDEAPGAYKNIHQVMSAQTELVEIIARFQPKIVRMADDGSRED